MDTGHRTDGDGHADIQRKRYLHKRDLKKPGMRCVTGGFNEECYFTTAEYIFLQCDCAHAFHSTSCDVVTTLLVKMDVCYIIAYILCSYLR